MNKPFYKRWMFWVIVIVVGGTIGLLTGNDDPADQATPAATEEAQPVVAEQTAEPTVAPSTGETSSVEASISWESAIKQISQSDTDPTQKADAAEVLARDYQPSAEEIKDFQSQIIEEFTAQNYLSQNNEAEYMLTNIFKSVVVERANEGSPIGDFAYDYYQNTKYTFRGADAPDSESVKSNEEQMKKALDKIK
ncbi:MULTISPECIES: hypothetical protein [unclassified Paenibacillus]|uniref:hypothetical protein n=1 Tax=unclassified Paenibacillus TaxID=185978 RepID=UPI0024072DEA|nr:MULTISPECIES: hypothetical protein [unclassified Paenibacillus]MDF9845408.1 membrane-bound lytic murein transglycosylase [Paenibacillus sp. PastF-2]MDF9851992.1 membrane-bound lytic murein transglycosylase [Paenibacillus sp. PastM-2]MDF9858523.1 membrane-bound lytic murein transglycosylase [Paenibacillus sp. PastF-1]MDH6483789.1 membrane-bound lytic murein transglycosylase [Paenibacillus sp. PastH-2]MDH6511188.1 membrane-bound lytic murein transglycosylase [Paenibacillus sp. PastM-3]